MFANKTHNLTGMFVVSQCRCGAKEHRRQRPHSYCQLPASWPLSRPGLPSRRIGKIGADVLKFDRQ